MDEQKWWRPAVDLSELARLADLLRRAGIPYEWKPEPEMGGATIKLPDCDTWYTTGTGASVIQHYSSYGGREGLLEVMVHESEEDESNPVGWLSAGEALALLKDRMKGD